jgi:hypothetical protein
MDDVQRKACDVYMKALDGSGIGELVATWMRDVARDYGIDKDKFESETKAFMMMLEGDVCIMVSRAFEAGWEAKG